MSKQRTFREYVMTGPLSKKNGATRGDYINALALVPAVVIGFLLAQLVVSLGSIALDIAVGCFAGGVTGLLYLYVAYRVDCQRT
ncbi:hypothetical protein CH296_06650 [Rhodococcus sp. 14-2496-1d]|uniref:hypothetical protein n=1 Tax=Rhodococcus sp. 14-2496-1d TaxID=2023146 RepID=UPI000B9C4AA3|nr:hypothetical protein [Rhodococcus sp. 14-2496-1d]OZF36745.1 hypothetical protein CH296_06650 [Rhodococcus sp. 14-2496-1d]